MLLVIRLSAVVLLLGACQYSSSPETTLRAEIPSSSASSPQEIQHIINFPIPDQLTFAGETVPLDDPDVRERLEQELMKNGYLHASTVLLIKRSTRWRPMIEKELEQAGVPKDFFYLAVAESQLSNKAVSYKGALGMWQFLKTTAKEFGLEVNRHVDERKDPYLATQAAIGYLKRAHKKFGNWTLVAAAYNRGMRGLSNALESQKEQSYYDLYLNSETYQYVFRILALKLLLESPETYGFHIAEEDRYQPWEFTEVAVKSPISDLPTFAQEHKTTYKMLKRLNPWLDSPDYQLPVRKGKTYQIRIPG